jgi:hypothetical protein
MCSHGNSTFGATTLFYLPLTRPSGNNTFGAIRGVAARENEVAYGVSRDHSADKQQAHNR